MRIRMTPAFNKKNIALLLVLLFVLIVAAVYPYAPSELSASDDSGLMRIVEVMTANTSLFVNLDGKICDYVKLENMGDAPVNLLGWGLSDHFNKAKYTFSECILQPTESVFVFLDRQWAGQRYLERYASFSLSSSGRTASARTSFKSPR